MAENATPQSDIVHDPPSLPSSPHPKRMKHAEPANFSVASILNDSHQPSPTPGHANLPSPMAAEAHPAELAAHQSLPPMPSMTFEPAPPALQVKFLSTDAKAPTRGSAFAAGYDLYAARAATVPAWGKALVDTDISIALPASTYGRVAPRSGLASKHSIHTGAGVIDADYRGPLKVLLFNLSGSDFKVEVHERIAQLIVERIYTPDIVVVDQLEQTVRGAGGFGSTGGFGGSLPGINGVAGVAHSSIPATVGGAAP